MEVSRCIAVSLDDVSAGLAIVGESMDSEISGAVGSRNIDQRWVVVKKCGAGYTVTGRTGRQFEFFYDMESKLAIAVVIAEFLGIVKIAEAV